MSLGTRHGVCPHCGHDHGKPGEFNVSPLFKINSELSEQLSAANARIAEMEAQLQKAKAMPMKYRRMEFNAQLQQENKALQARVKELESEYKECRDDTGRLSAECFELTAHCEGLYSFAKELLYSSERIVPNSWHHGNPITYGTVLSQMTPPQSLATIQLDAVQQVVNSLSSEGHVEVFLTSVEDKAQELFKP